MLTKLFKRKPDFIVGGHDNPYLLRWWIIPRNRFFNIYLHKFLRDDDDRALHCHPWWSISIIIKGGYLEHLQGRGLERKWRYCPRWSIIFRPATHRHRIELLRDIRGGGNRPVRLVPTWTIFITGRRVREWGFWCEGYRFIPWQDFTSPGDSGTTGKGCDQ